MHFHIRCGPCGAAAGSTDHVVVGIWVKLFDANRELVHWDIDGPGDVAGIEFVWIPDIQNVGVVGYFVYIKGFKVTHVAIVNQQNARLPAKPARLSSWTYTVNV